METRENLAAPHAPSSPASKILLPPIGFWSYARQDDDLSLGRLSALRSLLIQELQQQYGREPIKLFQDTRTIPHGSDWEKEIRKALDRSMFFIPIVTPNFLQSEWCCQEVEFFLEQENRLASLYPDLPEQSRIFPILFIDIEDVDPEKPEVLGALQKLQWFDFRRFRHRSFDEASVREALSDLARTMRVLMKTKVSAPAGGKAAAEVVEDTQPTSQVEVRTHVVDLNPPPEAGPPPKKDRADAQAAPRPIEVGDVLNHIFEVKRFIKQGGMGQVFEGSNVINGERVAIKALVPALAAEPKVIAMFQREALTLTRLQNEALVQYRVLARDPVSGSFYIVTEYIDGVDLGEALAKVDRSPKELNALLMRLALGLDAAHKLGAIHRDISPDNVMLPNGDLRKAKIIDFGIAKDLGGELPTLIGSSFAGKLSFVAPEQLGDHGGEIGPWTDIYSLGLVMLSVAGGVKVDMGGSIADAIRKRRQGADLSAAPESLRPLLEEMLRPDPAERLRSMEAVIVRLADVTAFEFGLRDQRKRLAEAKAERRGAAEADAEARRETEAEAARLAAEREVEARRKAEAAARKQAEEARLAAERQAKARRKAETDAKRNAEQARQTAERETKARRKAEAEAARQAEAARLAAEREAEARRQAETEAEGKRRAEEEVRAARLEVERAAEARQQAEAEAERLAGIAATHREAEERWSKKAAEALALAEARAAATRPADEIAAPPPFADESVALVDEQPLEYQELQEDEARGPGAKLWIALGLAAVVALVVAFLVFRQPVAVTPPAPQPGTVTGGPVTAPSGPGPAAASTDPSWLYRRWCELDERSGRPNGTSWTISGNRRQLQLSDGGRPESERIVELGSDLVRTNAHVFRRVADGRTVHIEGAVPITLGNCR